MIAGKVQLTAEQRQKESAVLWAIILDQILIFYMLIIGIFSGSMTFISESMRCTLLVTVEYVSYFVLRRSHRGKFREYEFGTGKIERIVNLMVAFGLCLASFYIFQKLMAPGEEPPMSTGNMMLAVISGDLNLIANLYFALAFIRVNRNENSMIIASQIKSRRAKTVASFIVLIVLILTLWLPDPKSARMVDTLGSVFVLLYMLGIAYELVRESLPEILDRTVPEPEQFQILRILTAHFEGYDGFKGYKTRRSGKDLFVQLDLRFFPHTRIEEIRARLSPIEKALESDLPGARVTIVPHIMDT